MNDNPYWKLSGSLRKAFYALYHRDMEHSNSYCHNPIFTSCATAMKKNHASFKIVLRYLKLLFIAFQ